MDNATLLRTLRTAFIVLNGLMCVGFVMSGLYEWPVAEVVLKTILWIGTVGCAIQAIRFQSFFLSNKPVVLYHVASPFYMIGSAIYTILMVLFCLYMHWTITGIAFVVNYTATLILHAKTREAITSRDVL